MEWQTSEPPVGVKIEFERDDNLIQRGVLEVFGLQGRAPSGKPRKMRRQFKRQGVAEMFEVRRWRSVE